jgi:hypothetical protein
MPRYEVRLKSQTDDQSRTRILAASSQDEAARLCEELELARVRYSLLDRQPVRQIETRRHAEGMHATINLDAFADSGLGGHDLLAYVERAHAIDADGKAHGPHRHVKEHLAAHYQREPYKVIDVAKIDPLFALIQGLKQLHETPVEWDELLERMRAEGIPLNVVTGSLYGLTAQKMIDGSTPIVWTTATLKVALTTSTYTPNQDTHHFFSDITNEVTGTGYTAGGATLASPTTTYDTATDQIRLDAADTSWTTSTITARDAIVWNDTAGASTTDPVIGWVNFGADVSTTAGTFSIVWDATGIVVYDVT